ncbi:MAG: flippase [Methanothrix sp.]|uniref:flippase n=1 Tax=Methanothrix sp. TaxID=90426 RepID=UPI0032AF6238|nr:flippase [Methanothrix sp.]
MNNRNFARGTAVTFCVGILNLLLGMGTSVILARILGPEGNGAYYIALLLPSFIITFVNVGIGPATVYYVARGEFRWQEILGNNVLLSIAISVAGILTGLIVVIFFREIVFPGIMTEYLLLALVLVPLEIFFSYLHYILLGAQRIEDYNYAQVCQSVLFFGFVFIALFLFRAGVAGAILAGIFTWIIVDLIILRLTKKIAGGINFKPNICYIKRASKYGIQAHISNILGFLNYRIDMVLVNFFLGPAAVGLYAVGVGLVERLWIISQSASTVLFPIVSAETNERSRKDFTPLVARTVMWITTLGALAFVFFSRYIVLLLYSEKFLPTVGALQALLPGIIALSAGRVLANDIAGRGFPRLNIYSGVAAVITNVALNLLWIPTYGIVGAAWASTVSYVASFLCFIYFYSKLSGNRWSIVVLPQKGDFSLYWKSAKATFKWVCWWR